MAEAACGCCLEVFVGRMALTLSTLRWHRFRRPVATHFQRSHLIDEETVPSVTFVHPSSPAILTMHCGAGAQSL